MLIGKQNLILIIGLFALFLRMEAEFGALELETLRLDLVEGFVRVECS